mmetsp:Transcript_8133/g.19081  ORF Transcript_8133/g.19081 Transcript_8133/m.19081 type:complete len:430 (-) Transcript_8133:46-1335(-)
MAASKTGKKFKSSNLNTLLGAPKEAPTNFGPAVRSSHVIKPVAKPKGLVSLGKASSNVTARKGAAWSQLEEKAKKDQEEKQKVDDNTSPEWAVIDYRDLDKPSTKPGAEDGEEEEEDETEGAEASEELAPLDDDGYGENGDVDFHPQMGTWEQRPPSVPPPAMPARPTPPTCPPPPPPSSTGPPQKEPARALAPPVLAPPPSPNPPPAPPPPPATNQPKTEASLPPAPPPPPATSSHPKTSQYPSPKTKIASQLSPAGPTGQQTNEIDQVLPSSGRSQTNGTSLYGKAPGSGPAIKPPRQSLETVDADSSSEASEGSEAHAEHVLLEITVPRTALVINVSHVLKRLNGCCSLNQLTKNLKSFKEKTGVTLEQFLRANPMTFKLEGRIVYLVDRDGEKWKAPPESSAENGWKSSYKGGGGGKGKGSGKGH